MIKVNAKNYKSVTKGLDFSKFSKSIQDAHKEFDDFLEFYNDDAEIKKMLDNHFKAVEKELNKAEKPKTTRKTLKPKEDKYRISLNEGSFQFDQYFSSSSLKVTQQSAIKKMQKQVDYRASDKSIWATIDEKINGSWEEVDRIKFKAKGEVLPKPTTKKTTKTSKAKTSSKKKTPKKAIRKANEVDLMPLEIKIIRRYINLHGKKVTERQVSLLYKVIQKAATEKTIRKSSKYASEIKQIGNDLISTYKEMDNTCTFEVPERMYNKLKAVVDSYGVTPAVSLIKRFINLYGNITKAKAQRLLTTVTNSLKNGKVSKRDSEYEQVENVQKHLTEYLDSDKLLVTNVQLQGLKGIAGMGK